MMWFLVYVALVVSSSSNFGMMTTGPFESEDACTEYAYKTWELFTEPNLTSTRKLNWFSTRHSIHFLEHEGSQMGIYFSCVNPRDPSVDK